MFFSQTEPVVTKLSKYIHVCIGESGLLHLLLGCCVNMTGECLDRQTSHTHSNRCTQGGEQHTTLKTTGPSRERLVHNRVNLLDSMILSGT